MNGEKTQPSQVVISLCVPGTLLSVHSSHTVSPPIHYGCKPHLFALVHLSSDHCADALSAPVVGDRACNSPKCLMMKQSPLRASRQDRRTKQPDLNWRHRVLHRCTTCPAILYILLFNICWYMYAALLYWMSCCYVILNELLLCCSAPSKPRSKGAEKQRQQGT